MPIGRHQEQCISRRKAHKTSNHCLLIAPNFALQQPDKSKNFLNHIPRSPICLCIDRGNNTPPFQASAIRSSVWIAERVARVEPLRFLALHPNSCPRVTPGGSVPTPSNSKALTLCTVCIQLSCGVQALQITTLLTGSVILWKDQNFCCCLKKNISIAFFRYMTRKWALNFSTIPVIYDFSNSGIRRRTTRRRFRIDVRCVGTHPFGSLSRPGLNQIKLS